MTEIRFYHMQVKRLEKALPEILAKALERGHRIVVKAGSAERVAALDTALWTHDPASFLPHGHAKDGTEARQPVWITTEDDIPNAADVLVLTDGAASARLGDFKLVCELFDGTDDEAVATARARWKSYKDAGHNVSYIQQDAQGKWVQRQ